jgi:hypothetical protein
MEGCLSAALSSTVSIPWLVARHIGSQKGQCTSSTKLLDIDEFNHWKKGCFLGVLVPGPRFSVDEELQAVNIQHHGRLWLLNIMQQSWQVTNLLAGGKTRKSATALKCAIWWVSCRTPGMYSCCLLKVTEKSFLGFCMCGFLCILNLNYLYSLQDALRALWRSAFPGRTLPGLVSEQWKEMGWQGTDPSTDFRCVMTSCP